MPVPQLAIAAAPYAGALAMTAARAVCMGFGLIAGLKLAEQVFSFGRSSDEAQTTAPPAPAAPALAEPTPAAFTPPPVVDPRTLNGRDPHPVA